MKQQVIARDEVTFARIREKIGSSLDLHRFDVEGTTGGIVMARIKCTTRAGLIRSARLHAVIRYESGKCEQYAEQTNGNFKCTGTFRAGIDEFATTSL